MPQAKKFETASDRCSHTSPSATCLSDLLIVPKIIRSRYWLTINQMIFASYYGAMVLLSGDNGMDNDKCWYQPPRNAIH